MIKILNKVFYKIVYNKRKWRKKKQEKRKYFFIIFNFFAFLTNISFLNYKKTSFNFKNSDKYIFCNKKDFIKINSFKSNAKAKKSEEKMRISLICKDTLFNINCAENYKKMLEDLNYLVQIDNEMPDFLIYDVFGCEHTNKKYNKSIKIAEYSENIIPDFSEADYALSQAHLIYLDRYYKFPSFIYYLNKFRNYNVKSIGAFQKKLTKRKFCAAVISNHNNYTFFRIKFIKELNKYKHVDMGGSYLNDFGKQIQDKIKFLSSYKFSISMENSNGDGYISEKVIDSLIAGTIPIYYGDYLIDEYINPKCYILIKGQKDIHSKIEYIKKIDNDEKLYNDILKEQIFVNDNYMNIMYKINKERSLFVNLYFYKEKIKLKE